MTAVDGDIEVFACGNRLTDWNEPVIEELSAGDWLTDHVLVECHADRSTDPVELFNAHSGFASKLGEQYDAVARRCREAGLTDVRQAITELQLFTRFDEPDEGEGGDADAAANAADDGDARLTRETLPTNKSVTEVVFDATVFHEAVRSDTVEMVTHSGVGNHGGGIRKNRGRVWADPCYYGQALAAGLAGGTPVGVDVTCDTFSTETTWGTDTTQWFGELEPVDAEPAVDAVAATDAAGGELVVTLVHCDAGAAEIAVTVDGGDLLAGVDAVTVDTLAAETMHAENTVAEPERVTPETTTAAVEDGAVTVDLPPYALVRLTVDDR
jgi:alpha-N-arabinofuranosidase